MTMQTGWSRRAVLRAAAQVAAAGGTTGWLAACSGSDKPGGTPSGAPSAAPVITAEVTSPGVIPTEVSPVTSVPATVEVTEAPIPRAGYPRANSPVELPDNGLEPIATGAAPEPGPLRILNYPDYVSPEVVAAFEAATGVKVEVETFDEVAIAEATIRAPGHGFDIVMGLPSLVITGLVVDAIVQPLNKERIPNFGNVFGAFQNPYYDVGAKYSLPYNVYTTGISYRRDRVSEELFNRDDAWPMLWEPRYSGKVHLLPDVRDGLALGLIVNGVFDLNTDDPAEIDRAAAVLRKLVTNVGAEFDIYSYENIPADTSLLQQAWSGDMLQARNYLEGQSPEVLGYWHPTRAPVSNDMFMICAEAKNPVLAHQFIDHLLDPANARANFDFVGYQPAVASPTAFDLTSSGAVPEHLLGTLVYDADVAIGYRIDPIEPAAQALWDAAWGTVTG